MSAVKFSKGSDMFCMFGDFYKLCQSFWEPENNDEYFERFVQAQSEFTQKYKQSSFARALSLALADEINRKSMKFYKQMEMR